jgi:ADP-ribose pyrophosphatase
MARVIDVEIESDERIGEVGGFLVIRRVRLHNLREDGSRSPTYVCDFVVRPIGLDAVVVAVWTRARGRVEVLLREGLRPSLALGRAGEPTPLPDGRRRLYFTEVVAGIVEAEDQGEAGIRARAACEVAEEAGFEVAADAVELLGAGTFPTPGSMPERFYLAAVEIAEPAAQGALDGDGSPMEEGAATRWMALDDAIRACVRGEIEDAKTELALRRLRDHLGA